MNELDALLKPDGSYSTIPMDGYGLLNVSAGVARGPWDLGFYVRNVTDEEYWIGGTNTGGGKYIPGVMWGEPRTWELSLSYHVK
ncbi:MAG: TonB-dependent receptor [Proteobacteria bacterium]|nr:TonB-dependent receptor [Pseudomonadota bacterium]